MWFDVPPSGTGVPTDDEARKELLEPQRVLGGEPARDDVLAGVVVARASPGGRRTRSWDAPERRGRAPKLQRLGPVLGVVDRDELAACCAARP